MAHMGTTCLLLQVPVKMNCLLGCVRLILAFLNLLLFIAFAVVGTMGLLLKFNKDFLLNLLEKVTTKLPQKEMEEIVKFIQNFGSALSIGFIVIGFSVAIIALIGLFALFCKNRFLGFIYITLLAILSGIELGLIIYLFAVPGNLEKAAAQALTRSFDHLQTNDSLTEASYTLWTVLGSVGDNFCCGLVGYQDFGELLPGLSYPPPCCKQNITTANDAQQQQQATSCDANEAKKQDVKGCEDKVNKFLEGNKKLFVGINCGVLAFQILVLLVMCALYKKWKSE
ncbi:hypothetical protein TcWFU_000007 [Taenia crassiceps]|uniref:Tetraspanin n=1 Tax=Taenia crassiceps TaxID=6207 RepID=A0ABR4Q2Z0_9CEST